MIYIGNKETSQIFVGGKAITAVYHGTKLVWEAIRSCFGRGIWMNDKPWKNDDVWRNHA